MTFIVMSNKVQKLDWFIKFVSTYLVNATKNELWNNCHPIRVCPHITLKSVLICMSHYILVSGALHMDDFLISSPLDIFQCSFQNFGSNV